MKRLTKLSELGKYYIVDSNMVSNVDEGYYGDAIEKLAKFENLYDHLAARQRTILEEMEKLRSGNKTKSYKFKELLAQKLMNEELLRLISVYGLE